MKASSSEGSYGGILDQQNVIIQVGIVPGPQKRTLKVGKLNSISPQFAGQATRFLTRVVLVLFICLYCVNTTGQVLATVIGNGACRSFDENWEH